MENILAGGIYRREEVVISGASHIPPAGNEMYGQIKSFYRELAGKNRLNGIELAAWTHAEFVRIHPFLDDHVIIRTKLDKPSKIKGVALI